MGVGWGWDRGERELTIQWDPFVSCNGHSPPRLGHMGENSGPVVTDHGCRVTFHGDAQS